MTRGHLSDLECVRAVLGRRYRYAGFMGSARKTRLILEQMRAEGFDPAQVAALCGAHRPGHRRRDARRNWRWPSWASWSRCAARAHPGRPCTRPGKGAGPDPMRLAEALPPLPPGPGRVIALVGAGGKTSALFGLAGDLARARPGPGSCSPPPPTSTIRAWSEGRGFDRLVLAPALADPAREPPGLRPRPAQAPCRVVLAAREEPGPGQAPGHPPGPCGPAGPGLGLRDPGEADGAKRLPVKAPAGHEPVLPPASGLVLGFVGLACLGRPMDGRTVHRPELFGPAHRAALPGAPIALDHLAALARSPRGLFQGAPAGARRVLVLNQADLCPEAPAALVARLAALGLQGVDRVLVCVLGAARPEARVVRVQRCKVGQEAGGPHP